MKKILPTHQKTPGGSWETNDQDPQGFRRGVPLRGTPYRKKPRLEGRGASLSIFYFLLSRKQGQTLIEVLLATIVGMVFILATVALIQPALKIGSDAQRTQAETALARELLDSVRVFAEARWYNIAILATTSLNHYYLNIATSPFAAVPGEETITVSTTTYTRYFYVDDARRDGSWKITEAGGTVDPSTKKITAVFSWPGSATRTMGTYLTRSANRIFVQTDWSGGAGQEGPVTSTNNRFATSSGVNFTTTTGSILIDLP